MKILVVDDELGLRHSLSMILAEDDHEVVLASGGAEALRTAASERPDLILCDVRMPGMDGFAFLDAYRATAKGHGAIAIMMSAYGDDEAAVEAIQRGAYDFIAKPFRADQVLLVLRKAIERERLRRQVAELNEEVAALRAPSGMVGRSTAMQNAIMLASKVARHPSAVLVTGEIGTGKELLAKLIHDSGPRAKHPFVSLSCDALPDEVLERELFGQEGGAGGGPERRGLLEEADGGTLFLDDIGNLPASMQDKLLRLLQEAQFRRVGGQSSRHSNARIVAATARELEADVSSGRFRSDLYYRINVVRVHLPPLRARTEDIPDLVRHFVSRFNARLGLSVRTVAPAAMRLLMEHGWPGNVRELENAIERTMVVVDGTQIEVSHLPASVRAPLEKGSAEHLDLSVKRQTEALERQLIERALRRTNGNRTRAARLLDLSHRALLYKIREYGLDQ